MPWLKKKMKKNHVKNKSLFLIPTTAQTEAYILAQFGGFSMNFEYKHVWDSFTKWLQSQPAFDWVHFGGVYELLRLHCKNLFFSFFFFFDHLNQVYLILRSGRSMKPVTHFDRGNMRNMWVLLLFQLLFQQMTFFLLRNNLFCWSFPYNSNV